MSDPFKRGPRRMFPTAPEVAPLSVEPQRGEFWDPAARSWDDPAPPEPPTVDVREAWDSLTTADRVQAATVARGEQLDDIGALCRRSRHGLTDTVYRLDIVNAIRSDPERRIRHVEFRAVRSPSATEDELERMFRAPLYGDPRPAPSRADIEHASGPNLVALANSVGLDLRGLNSVGEARNALLEHCGHRTIPRRP